MLLKLGLDLCMAMDCRFLIDYCGFGDGKNPQSAIQNHKCYSIGGGSLLVCLSPAIPQADVELLALGLVAWHKQLNPAGEITVVFRDSAFGHDVGKTNLAAILNQYGLQNVRSL